MVGTACFLLLTCSLRALSLPVEEFTIRGPTELHSAAINTFIKERERDPANKESGNDTPIMRRARDHAVKRFSAVPIESLQMQIIGEEDGESGQGLLSLPSPGDAEAMLASSVTALAGGSEVMSLAEKNAMSALLNEDIGMGAISRAGALPMGENMEWVKFVEDKMRRDAEMDHQSLLWELGSEVMEAAQVERGGLNLTQEEDLLGAMKEWFIKGGGTLKYVEPSVTQEEGYQLLATEPIEEGEVVAHIPVKLTMCRITARNVLLPKKGKYLGEELKKTFEKNEVWALSVFLLHEWYKETAGKGSKVRCVKPSFMALILMNEMF